MKFLNIFRSLWRFVTGDKAKAVLQKIDDMIEVALPIVRTIAQMTPTRADDEIVALFERYGLEVRMWAQGWMQLPSDQRGKALLYVAEQELAKAFPKARMNEISAAVNLAVSVMKSESQP